MWKQSFDCGLRIADLLIPRILLLLRLLSRETVHPLSIRNPQSAIRNPQSSVAPQFPVVDLQAAQHSLEGRAEIVILVVGGDEDRVDDVAVFEFARIELRALAAPGRGRASDER